MGILLNDTNDVLRLTVTGTIQLDATSWYSDADVATGPPPDIDTFGSSEAVTTSPTTIVDAPAGTNKRNVKEFYVFNTHASATATVTVERYDGTTAFRLWKGNILAGECLTYTELMGFVLLDVNGLVKQPNTPNPSGSAIIAQIASFSADTYIGANLNIANRIQAGSFFRWYLVASKGAGTATPTFIIRTGTAGAIGDTARLTMTGLLRQQ
jgi:hypothetical protein